MRLGVVLTGVGIYGAAGAGVLCELLSRRMEPYAVCGLGTGAWPCALFVCGADEARLRDAAAMAQRMGVRMLRRNRSFGGEGAQALYRADALERLLSAQTGGRTLALCPGRAVIPVRMARQEREVVFATQAFAPERNGLLVMQATLGFAARAAMGLSPYLAPSSWMGNQLIPQMDASSGAALLLEMGAQRVLVAEPVPSLRRELDALELAALSAGWGNRPLPAGAVRLPLPMPEGAAPLRFSQITACLEAGKRTAERELDRLLGDMGLAACRVLPFRR